MTCFDMKEAFVISVKEALQVNNIHQSVNSVHFNFDLIEYKILSSMTVELKMFCRSVTEDGEGLNANPKNSVSSVGWL